MSRKSSLAERKAIVSDTRKLSRQESGREELYEVGAHAAIESATRLATEPPPA